MAISGFFIIAIAPFKPRKVYNIIFFILFFIVIFPVVTALTIAIKSFLLFGFKPSFFVSKSFATFVVPLILLFWIGFYITKKFLKRSTNELDNYLYPHVFYILYYISAIVGVLMIKIFGFIAFMLFPTYLIFFIFDKNKNKVKWVIFIAIIISQPFLFIMGTDFGERLIHLNDPCYKVISYPGKGFGFEVKEGKVCMELKRSVNTSYIGIVKEADAETFHELDGRYFADKNSVFYESKKLENVSPDSFLVLSSSYAKGSGKVFYCGEEFEADFDTLEIVSGKTDYARDKNNVYKGLKKISVLDSENFDYLGSNYYADQYNVYHDSMEFKLLKGADPKTFYVFKDKEYAKDKNHAYYYGKEIKGADADTFKVLANVFAIDRSHIYSSEYVLEDLDINQLEQVGHSDYLRDNDSLYYREKKVENINVNDFHLVGYRKQESKGSQFISDSTTCGTDGITVVCNGNPIAGGEIIDISETMGTINEFDLKLPNK